MNGDRKYNIVCIIFLLGFIATVVSAGIVVITDIFPDVLRHPLAAYPDRPAFVAFCLIAGATVFMGIAFMCVEVIRDMILRCRWWLRRKSPRGAPRV